MHVLSAACLVAGCNGPSVVQPLTEHAVLAEEAASFRSGTATLSGTIVRPAAATRSPAVVLFHGSGPQRRDLTTARWFAEQGILALAYDKRGVGESTGDFRTVPFTDLCDDGLAAIDLLKGRSDVDANRIGVWGLSQGGWLAPLAASRSPDVKFVIAVSGPGVSPGEQMIFFYASQLRHEGLSESEIAEASAVRRTVWKYLSTGTDRDVTDAALSQAASKPWFSKLQAQQDGLFARTPADIIGDVTLRTGPWFRKEANYDPRLALRKLSVPALFLFGEDDELVPVPASAAIIDATLRESDRRDFMIRVFPHADHTIRVEQPDGSRVLAPDYLETTSRWLSAHGIRPAAVERPLSSRAPAR